MSDAFAAKWEVPAEADVAITKSANRSVVSQGETITYVLTLSNAGWSTATGILVSDTIPSILINVNHTRSGAAITPTGGISYTWEVQDLAPGAGGVITVTGVVSPGLGYGLVFSNTATITGTTMDSNAGNNSSSVRVMVPHSRVFLPSAIKD